jgi:TonB family protein
MDLRLIVVALILGLAACATPREPLFTAPDGTPVYGQSFAPRPDDGRIVIQCAVLASGAVDDCSLVEAHGVAPEVAEAMLRHGAANFRMNPPPADRVGQRVNIPISVRED